jgi:hypothetical protein
MDLRGEEKILSGLSLRQVLYLLPAVIVAAGVYALMGPGNITHLFTAAVVAAPVVAAGWALGHMTLREIPLDKYIGLTFMFRASPKEFPYRRF